MLLQVLIVPRPLLEEQEDVVDVLVAVPELIKIVELSIYSRAFFKIPALTLSLSDRAFQREPAILQPVLKDF